MTGQYPILEGLLVGLFMNAMFFGSELIFAWLMTRLLKVPNKALYWLATLALMIATPFVRSVAPTPVVLVTSLCMISLPIVLSSGPLGRRLLLTTIAMALNLLCDALIAASWASLSGFTETSYETVLGDPALFASLELMRFAMQLVVSYALIWFVERFFPDAAAAADDEVPAVLRHFAWFPIMQFTLLSIAFFVITYQCDLDAVMNLVLSVIAGLCAIVDVLLLRSFSRANRAVKEAARAEAMQAQLDEYLRFYEQTMEQVTSAARVRHDLRNQVQVASAMAERGEFEHAHRYVQGMLAEAQRISHELGDDDVVG